MALFQQSGCCVGLSLPEAVETSGRAAGLVEEKLV